MVWKKCLMFLCAGLLVSQPLYAANESAFMSHDRQAEALLAQMSLRDKIGQMTLVDIRAVTPEQARDLRLGAVLSGGGATPKQNTPAAWRDMVSGYEQAALQTPLQIPLMYGIDAVHGHGNVYGATIFPHNIGLGATGDPGLVERIGAATGEELAATGIYWDYAPALELPQDYRWGRTYEGFSEAVDVTSELGASYIQGLQSQGVAATAKHYVSAGAASWGTSGHEQYAIDQGGSDISEAELRAKYLPPFQAAVAAGAATVMVSLNTWQGEKIHADKYLITTVLKHELGFQGLVVSDWDGVKSLGPDYHANIVRSINAGMDMVMLSSDPQTFEVELMVAIRNGEIPMSRIDDAVLRILKVKFAMGYFDESVTQPAVDVIGSEEHRELARQAVRESATLLKNDNDLLPLPKDEKRILVAGAGADDIGMQSGGWTITWQGGLGDTTPGTTLLEAITAAVSPGTKVDFSATGNFKKSAPIGIVVVGEKPYAEGFGDKADLHLEQSDIDLINRVKTKADKVIVILYSGRPMIVTDNIHNWDAFVAAWLPGTEAQGLADVLFGDYPFTATLPFTWPSSMADLPMTDATRAQALWPYGYGLTTPIKLANGPTCQPLSLSEL